MDGLAVLDIRQDREFTSGHVRGARHVELGALRARGKAIPTGPTVVMCDHGERATSAASLLARDYRRDRVVLDGGPDDWAAATNRALETGR